ncbi:leucine-rich repeat and guanylate kinase domain-containing protein isoform X2 [Passer domesticus]|uniref:leucine-rich repeat and guanylate kinase domain-containing protein isoform X2 n=1 Tax=Passer domesticus TaxID=48849 RepID=UPI0030FF3D9A
MAGGEENGAGEGSLGEPLPASDGPPQPLAEGLAEERPRPGPPHREDEEEEEESERSEGPLEGVLDEDTAAEGLHTFGRSAPGTEYVYLHLSLPGRDLSDISILSGYVHLQKMDLSCNKINDLSCVSHMPYLVELNASKNQLTTYFNFKAPKNLREVDFSHNQIPKMKDLSAYHALTKLLLDCNELAEVRGLERCRSLSQLGLAHNRLAAVTGLQGLPIRSLDLSFNQIEKVNGLKSLKNLQRVDLSHNKINSLQGLEEHDLLEVINLEDNQVAELSELQWIEDLPLLRVLNLLKNPLQKKDGYWLSAIFMLLQVTDLDLKKVSVKEKVAAVNKEDPPPEVVAAEDHRLHLLYGAQQPQRVLPSTLLPPELPYPVLVLVGPEAGGRRELALKICRKFRNFFRFGPCHTTREAYFGEENRFDYYFVSQEEFDKMVKAGAHSLKKTHFEPRYVLVVPTDRRKYREHLRRTGLFSRPEVEAAVARLDTYLRLGHGGHGGFHALINSDELEEAFTELTRLVRVYLGMEPLDVPDSIQGSGSWAGSRNEPFPAGRGAAARPRAPSRGHRAERPPKTDPRNLLGTLAAPPGSALQNSRAGAFPVEVGLRLWDSCWAHSQKKVRELSWGVLELRDLME